MDSLLAELKPYRAHYQARGSRTGTQQPDQKPRSIAYARIASKQQPHINSYVAMYHDGCDYVTGCGTLGGACSSYDVAIN